MTDGKYDPLSFANREQRRERRWRLHRFGAYLFAILSALSLLSFVLIERDNAFLFLGATFALLATLHFGLSNRRT